MRGVRLILGLAAGAALSLAAPASQVAHGHAHEHLLEHAADADHAAALPGELEVRAPEQHDDHAHAAIDPGLCSRCAGEHSPAPAALACENDIPELRTRAAAPPIPNESPPDPDDRTPTQPRAPPVLLTIQ